MRLQGQNNAPLKMSGAFASFLLTSFLVMLSVLTLTAGVNAYASISDSTADNTNKRDALLYVIGKFRAMDGNATIKIDHNAADGDLIRFMQKFDDELYETRIYCSGGYLKELLCAVSDPFNPEDGELLIKADAIYVTGSEPNFQVTVKVNGDQSAVGYVCAHSLMEAP